MEARTAFDRLLIEGDQPVPERISVPVEPDDAAVVRQNREALRSWGAAGVPVPVIQ